MHVTQQAFCPPGDTSEEVILLLIDNFHTLYPQRGQECLWGYIKSLMGGGRRLRLRLVCAGLFADYPEHQLSSPFSYSRGQLVGAYPGQETEGCSSYGDEEPDKPSLPLTAAEYDELWQATWGDQQQQLFAGDATKQEVLWVSSAQVGWVTHILDELQGAVQQHPSGGTTPGQHLGDLAYRAIFRSVQIYRSLQGKPSFLAISPEAAPSEKDVQWQLLKPLLEAADGVGRSSHGPSVRVNGNAAHQMLNDLRNKGCLLIYYCLNHDMYSCPTPLHLFYLGHHLLPAHVPRAAGSSGPSSLPAFLQVWVKQLSATLVCEALEVGGSRPSWQESALRKLQMQLLTAALSVLPPSWQVCPDVNKRQGHTGLVDLWICGATETWALQLVRSDDDWAQHERRFEPGGKYSGMPATAYAVVDLRPPAGARPKPQPGQEHTYYMWFEAGFKAATLVRAADMQPVWGPEALLTTGSQLPDSHN